MLLEVTLHLLHDLAARCLVASQPYLVSLSGFLNCNTCCHGCQLSFPSALWNSSNHPRVVHNSLYPSIHMWFCSTRDERQGSCAGLVDPRLVWQDCVVWRRRSAPLPLHQQSTEHRCLLVAAALAARARRGRSQVLLLLATLAQHGFAPLQQRAGG